MNSASMALAGGNRKDAAPKKVPPCQVHPKYKGKMPPAKSPPGCTCKAVYDAKNGVDKRRP